MGRIIVSVKIENSLESDKSIQCDALVDTGASHLVLPTAWREQLDPLEEMGKIRLEMANQSVEEGSVCGPVRIQIEGFRPVFSEIIFIDMEAGNGDYEPLLGYIPLEQCQAAVDMEGHRLVPVKYLDLK